MRRLSQASLADHKGDIRVPGYDRTRIGIGMAHLGVGAFHRCHQAEYTDDAIEAQGGDWGVVGINLRPPALSPTLGEQDGLYTRWLRDGEAPDDGRIIGCVKRVIDPGADGEEAISALASPAINLVTLTITEKGYCHIPATGALNESHPDIVHDLAHPTKPRSAPGVLLAALERRRRAGLDGLTLISCDNISANGAILEAVVGRLSQAQSPALADWIAANARFPSTMVDRIVPATEADGIAGLSAALGLEDRAPVVGEPFRQWVIEDRFAGARPAWEVGGAQLVTDVAAYEQVKMRVLNGAQTSLCYLGALAGLATTRDDIRHPALENFARRMLIEETVSTLPAAPGMAPEAYVALTIKRLANPSIRHANHQIATDGSQKIVQRLLNPLRERLAAGASTTRLTCAAAGFIAYHARGATAYGAAWVPDDPFAPVIGAIANETKGDFPSLARRTLAIEAIFGRDLGQNMELVSALAGHLAGLLGSDPLGHVARL